MCPPRSWQWGYRLNCESWRNAPKWNQVVVTRKRVSRYWTYKDNKPLQGDEWRWTINPPTSICSFPADPRSCQEPHTQGFGRCAEPDGNEGKGTMLEEKEHSLLRSTITFRVGPKPTTFPRKPSGMTTLPLPATLLILRLQNTAFLLLLSFPFQVVLDDYLTFF